MQPKQNHTRILAVYAAKQWLLLSLLVALVFAVVSYLKVLPVGAQVVNEPMVIGPGLPQVGSGAPKTNASSSKAGSVLFFHKYNSDTSQPDKVNTLLTLTNTNPTDGATLRVLAVHDCTLEEKFINLGANQTRTLLASKEFPDSTGYIIAIAVNAAGAPTQFNWIIGAASVRSYEGLEGSYNAFAVAKRTAGASNLNGNTFDLKFDGVQFDRLPKVVALDNVQSNVGEVGIYSLPPQLDPRASGYNLELAATIYDPQGKATTSDVTGYSCGLYDTLNNLWSDTSFIKSGTSSWASFKAQDVGGNKKKEVPVLGVSFGAIPAKKTQGALTMQVLEWLDSYTVNVPLNVPLILTAPEAPTTNQVDAPGGATGASESKAGSLLFFPRFLSNTQGSTLLNLTNTHPAQKARVRIFFNSISPVPELAEKVITINPLQAVSLKVSDIAFGQRGWATAMAVNSGGQPIQFNYLIGSAQVTDVNNLSTTFNAYAVAKNVEGSVTRNADNLTADLLFDDTNFDRLPATTAASGITNQNYNNSYLSYGRLGNSLLDLPSIRGSMNITVYDSAGTSYIGLVGPNEVKLGDFRNYRFTPTLPASALQANAGWMKLPFTTPVFGVMLNYATSPVTPTVPDGWAGGISGSAHLHVLSSTEKFTLKVPSVNPGNKIPIAEAAPLDFEIEARSAAGTIVRLDARPSYDPDSEDTITYQWFDNDKLISNALVIDYRLGIGVHDIELLVTDASGATSDPYFQSVEVLDRTAPNLSRVPNNIKISTTTGSAVVNFPLPVAHDSVDGAVAVTTSRASGIPYLVGTHIVTFTATDRAGNKATATMDVLVTQGTDTPQTGGVADGIAPTLANIDDQYVTPGEIRKIVLQADDAEGDPITFRLLGGAANVALGNFDPVARRTTLFIGPLSANFRSTQFRVVANDNRRQSVTTAFFTISVSDIANTAAGVGGGTRSNRAPIAAMIPLPATLPSTEADGATVQLNGTGSSDPDLDSLTYTWSDNGQVIAQGAIVDLKLSIGQHSLVLTVNDGRGGTASTSPNVVQVLPRGLSVTGVTPSRLKQGTTTLVVISGTGFTSGAKVFVGSGVDAGTPINLTESSITVQLSVAADAPMGGRDVYVILSNGKTARLRAGLAIQ